MNQTLTLNFPEFLQYLNSLPEEEQGKTLQLIHNFQTLRTPEDKSEFQAVNENLNSNVQMKTVEISAVNYAKDLLVVQRQVTSFGNEVVQMHNPKGDELREVQEGEGNQKWQQFMEQVVNVQKSKNLQDGETSNVESKPETTEQENAADRQSIKFELLELIRKGTASENDPNHAKFVQDQKTEQDISKHTVYQTTDSAQIIEVSTSERFPVPRPIEHQTDLRDRSDEKQPSRMEHGPVTGTLHSSK